MSLLQESFFFRFAALASAACVAATASAWAMSHALRSAKGRVRLLPLWSPLALTVLVCGRHDLSFALTLLYSSSVTAVTLLLGTSLYFGPKDTSASQVQAEDSRASAILLLLLPLVIMLWLIGFRGSLDREGALSMLISGVSIAYAAWEQGTRASSGNPLSPAQRALCVLQAVLGILLALSAGLAAAQLGAFIRLTGGRIPVELVAVTPLAPILGIPLYAALARMAGARKQTQAAAVAGGFLLLNIGFLLPALTVFAALLKIHSTAATEETAAQSWWEAASGSLLGIPLILWRVENVILLVAVLALAGVRLGYYPPGRALGRGLLLLYLIYLFTSVVLRLS